MKTLRQVILENIEWLSTIYTGFIQLSKEINLCLCYLLQLLKISQTFLIEHQPETLCLLLNNACFSFS